MDLLYEYMEISDWEPPTEIVGHSSLWGPNGISPAGVYQSLVLGDCWFLSAASALAEHPARIEKLFSNRG